MDWGSAEFLRNRGSAPGEPIGGGGVHPGLSRYTGSGIEVGWNGRRSWHALPKRRVDELPTSGVGVMVLHGDMFQSQADGWGIEVGS